LQRCATSKVSDYSALSQTQTDMVAHAVAATLMNNHEGRFDASTDAAWSDPLGSVGATSLNTEDMEAFQSLSSEMFDPIMFEGLDASPWDGITNESALWNGFSLGL
jgi:hypothetical protein